MSHFNNIRTAVFEIYQDSNGLVVRLIALGEDVDTGAKYVEDIFEFDYVNASGKNWVTRIAAEYTELSDTSTEYFFRAAETDLGGGRISLDNIDTGRARKLQSRIAKAVDSVVAENFA